MALIILSLIVFGLYNAFVIQQFGIPYSISETFYKLEKRFPGKSVKYLFTGFCWGAGFLLMPAWFDSTPEKYQFIVFLSCGGLLFVGAAPNFLNKMEGLVHYFGAGFCVVMALLWCFLVAGTWYIILVSLTLFSLMAIRDRKWMFWIEIAAFTAVYISLFIHDL